MKYKYFKTVIFSFFFSISFLSIQGQIVLEYNGITYICGSSELNGNVLTLFDCTGFIDDITVTGDLPTISVIEDDTDPNTNGGGSSPYPDTGSGGSNNGEEPEEPDDPQEPGELEEPELTLDSCSCCGSRRHSDCECEETTTMGDPIDSITGLADVTDRFNQDIEEAMDHFCESYYSFLDEHDTDEWCWTCANNPVTTLNFMMRFVNDVKTGAPWDLKYPGHGYSSSQLNNKRDAIYNGETYKLDDFGNITFGIAAAAYGFSLEFAQGGAGFYQILSGTSSFGYMTSYFDDPRDSEMIEIGYSIFYSNGGCFGN